MEDYDFLTDVTISKVYEGKSGESQYGKWTAYNFYIKGDDRKFSYFKTDKSPLLPAKGMCLKMLRFLEETKGQYTNYNVKEMFLDKKPTQYQKPTSSVIPQSTKYDSSITMYISYAKDLLVPMINKDDFDNSMTLKELAKLVVNTGVYMYERVHEDPKPEQEPEAEPKQEPDYHGPPDYDEPPTETYDNDNIPY